GVHRLLANVTDDRPFPLVGVTLGFRVKGWNRAARGRPLRGLRLNLFHHTPWHIRWMVSTLRVRETFYKGLRELTAFSMAGYSTAAMFAGNFSETGRVISDPGSYTPASGNRQPFPGSLIP